MFFHTFTERCQPRHPDLGRPPETHLEGDYNHLKRLMKAEKDRAGYLRSRPERGFVKVS
jgi:hypothetical protein